MNDVRIDHDLLAEIEHRLELREPNRNAIESVAAMTSMHFEVDGYDSPFTCIVDSATGVGKTYVMAGLIDYFARIDPPVRNFLLLAPGRTIRDKSIKNFTRGHRKSLTGAMTSDPYVITADDFETQAARAVMADRSRTKLFVFTVQALTSRTGDGRATHDYQEALGGSLFQWLANLDDLVLLADEHHCYRGTAFARTIDELHPELVIGLTATPSDNDKDLVVYRYPLAWAIRDQLVKTPVLVGRNDDRSDDRTKLMDGVTLLRYKERLAHAYCIDNDLPLVNPVMLVIAQDTAEADQYRDMLDNESFDGGAWIGSTLVVHSNLNADDKEKALADLEAVEDPSSPVRVIISVGMLKEGWDVKNVYVIASMRASVSSVLTEQTLGRGMRLPFGAYTGIEMLDTVEVLAHERYAALLAKREALNEKFVDHAVLTDLRRNAEGRVVARKKVIAGDGGLLTGDAVIAEEPKVRVDLAGPAGGPTLVDLDSALEQAKAAAARTEGVAREHQPLPDRAGIAIPYTAKVPSEAVVSLNQVHDDEPFTNLGRALATASDADLKRTLLKPDDQGKVRGVRAAEGVQALALDIPLSETRVALVQAVMRAPAVRPQGGEVRAAERLVDLVIEGMGPEANRYLSAFAERAARRVTALVSEQLRAAATSDIVFEDQVLEVQLDKARKVRKEHVEDHTEPFSRAVAYNGWHRCLYEYAWFDTSPEYAAAQAIDKGVDVVVWARLHRNDLPITWTQEGRQYNPDLVAIEERDGTRTCWLIETKMNRDVGADEVLAKMKAAKTWANTVNNSGQVEGRWRYLLLSEDDVDDASGDWEQMKQFGNR